MNNKTNMSNIFKKVKRKYADASREIAYYYGLLCADLYRKSGFNPLTVGVYLKDGIHPNAVGGARIADIVIATFLEG